jgi:hypothetical protein
MAQDIYVSTSASAVADTTNACFNISWTPPTAGVLLYNITAILELTEIAP